jgi:hypothetical protein
MHMASSSEPSRKWGKEEDDEESRRCRLVKEGTALAPEEPEEVSSPMPNEPEEVPPPFPNKPEEVPPPPLDEAEEVPPSPLDELEEALALQPAAVVSAPPLNAEEATWSVNFMGDAFVRLRRVVVRLGVPIPNDPLQWTMKDHTFTIYILAGDLERGVLAPVDDESGDDGSLDGSSSDCLYLICSSVNVFLICVCSSNSMFLLCVC